MMDNAATEPRVAMEVRRYRAKIRALRYRIEEWVARRALDLVVWLNRDSNYMSHLEREAGEWFKGPDGPDRWIAEGTRDLLAVFASQGHSGGSYRFAIEFFSKMAAFEPWGPITGEEHEWSEPLNEKGLQQNLRCSHVFRSPDKGAYDIQGRVFMEGGIGFTSQDSHVPVTFPYTPTTEYVEVEEA